MNPEISVITTVYNCRNFIKESIDSILNQSFGNFEYIIVDDGSSDGTKEIINQSASEDSRIIFINSEQNIGRVKSLNMAVDKSRGNFIAIQDADDISLPERLQKQISFLENNPEYVLISSDVTVIDDEGTIISNPRRPHEDLDIKFNLLFKCTLANPGVMFRKNILLENNIRYEESFSYAEDFRMFTLISNYGRIYNLRERLILYRDHSSNSSNSNNDIISDHSVNVVKDNMKRIDIDINSEEAKRLRKLFSYKSSDIKFLLSDMKLFLNIIKTFQQKNGMKRCTEISKALKRMLRWPGKKKSITKPEFASLSISILKYYIKQAKLVKPNS